MGHAPLSRVNAGRLSALCLMAEFGDAPSLPATVVDVCGTIEELSAVMVRAGIPVLAGDERRCQEILATGQHVAAVGWSEAESGAIGLGHPEAKPLVAVAFTAPAGWNVLDLGREDPRRGCTGSLLAVAPRPLVPSPPDLERWTSSLLAGPPAAGALTAARSLCGDEASSWQVTVMDLGRCDGATTLHPVELDLARDLANASARTAASWCGLFPHVTTADTLRRVLADTTRNGDDAAFVVWAWSRQPAGDRLDVLERWTRAAAPLARAEAHLALAELDTADTMRRYLAILAAYPRALQLEEQLLVDIAGRRVVAAADRAHREALRAVADANAGWDEWRVGERLDRYDPSSPRSDVLRYGRGGEQLTAGAWAVAALVVTLEADALTCLRRALVESAVLSPVTATRQNHGRRPDGLRESFWNGLTILLPRQSSQTWPTLHRLEIAFAELPKIRDAVFRSALQDARLPDDAATVLLASLQTWTAGDEYMAVAILDAAAIPDDRCARFPGMKPPEGGSPFSIAAVGAAYVLAQRGVTAPILAALARDLPPGMRDELVFALALSLDTSAPVVSAIDAWRSDLASQSASVEVSEDSRLVAERITAVQKARRLSGAPYAARFRHDFRPAWWRY